MKKRKEGSHHAVFGKDENLFLQKYLTFTSISNCFVFDILVKMPYIGESKLEMRIIDTRVSETYNVKQMENNIKTVFRG